LAETERDAANEFDARTSAEMHDEGIRGMWRRYRRLPRNVFTIGLVSLLNDASSEIIYPLLPLFLTLVLGASPKVIGIIEGAAESISSLLKLFAGYFSDRRGRRKGFVVFGYAVANAVRPLLAFATSWYQVLAIRLTDRVGKGVRTAPRDALIADAVRPEERGIAFGFHRAMDHAGAMIGPLIGFLFIYFFAADRNRLTAHDYTKIFLLASVPALAAVLVAAIFLREREEKPQAHTLGISLRLSLTGFDSNFKKFLVVVALFTLSNSSDAFLIKRASDVGVSALSIPLLWAALHASKVLSSLVGGDLSDRLGRKTMIAAGWFLYAAVYTGFAFVSSAGEAWMLFLIYGIYFGLAEGTEKALVADLVRPEQRGTAFGLYNLAFSVTVLPASLLMGFIWDWRGATTAFILSGCLGASAALLLLTLVRTRTEQSATS